MGPHDAPDTSQLVEAVREWLEREVITRTDGSVRFHARVAANMLGMVERELELGAEHRAAHRARLDQLGVTDDQELAVAIRAGDFDDRLDELKALLRASVDDKLAVANPKYLAP